jgi:hypothetical protein
MFRPGVNLPRIHGYACCAAVAKLPPFKSCLPDRDNKGSRREDDCYDGDRRR